MKEVSLEIELLDSLVFKLLASNELVVDTVFSGATTDSVSVPNLDGVCERDAVQDEHFDNGLALRD